MTASFARVLSGEARHHVGHGDARALLREIPDGSVDAVVTDPPAGIEFMGKAWDRFDESEPNQSGMQTEEWDESGGADGTRPFARRPTPRYRGKQNASLLAFQDFIFEVFSEIYRVLKPGGYAVVWAIPRTSHHTAMGIERAGFDIRDRVSHVFGSGFPKSLNLQLAIADHFFPMPSQAPAVYAAIDEWEGWGTALKPAVEDWWICRKPLDGTVAANVLEYGTGGINIDGCRVGTSKRVPSSTGDTGLADLDCGWGIRAKADTDGRNPNIGRFPPNLILSHSMECKPMGTVEVSGDGHWPAVRPGGSVVSGPSGHTGQAGLLERDAQAEMVADWECVDGCPVAELDRQSGSRQSGVRTGLGYHGANGDGGPAIEGSEGGASRFFPQFQPAPYDAPFFYAAKASRREREAGCEHLDARTGAEAVDREEGTAGLSNPRAGAGRTAGKVRNFHPTVKPIDLMRWLCRLVTPPGGVILDPFTGSGSTGVAAMLEGFGFIGCEQDADYMPINQARIQHALRCPRDYSDDPPKRDKPHPNQMSLL